MALIKRSASRVLRTNTACSGSSVTRLVNSQQTSRLREKPVCVVVSFLQLRAFRLRDLVADDLLGVPSS